MPENTGQSEHAFQYLLRLLEDAVKAGADGVGLEREGQDLMVVHYFGAMGRATAPIRQDLEQAVIEEIIKRAGLADGFRGKMQVCLLGKDRDVVVDKHESFGESEFILTLKKSGKKKYRP